MQIRNVNIFNEKCQFEMGTLCVADGHFAKVIDEEDEVLDGEGCYAIPGLIDIHFHGCNGYDFCDGTKEAITQIAYYQASHGITTIMPATMTLSEKALMKICKTAATYKSEVGAHLAGIYLEGPFVSYEKRGAQNAKYIQAPHKELVEHLQEATQGLIKVVLIAPEAAQAMSCIEELSRQVTVSIGHTMADYTITKKALEKGAKQITHLYNAMPPFNHRKPGVIGAAFEDKNCNVELICDGVHVAPTTIHMTFQLFGEERIIFISDSMRATGMPEGVYNLGGQDVHVMKEKAILKDGTLAGSITHLMDCMLYAVKIGIPLESAIRCATINPAKAIGIDKMYGSISVGKVANFVLLNKDLSIKAVYIKGKRFPGK